MCMANLAAIPGNTIGGLWGDSDLGDKMVNATPAGKYLQSGDKALNKAFSGPQIKSSPITAQPQVQEVSAQQRRSLIS